MNDPEVPAKLVNGQLHVKCPDCGRVQYHSPEYGHRVSHCPGKLRNRGGELRYEQCPTRGYVLVPA